MQPIDFKARTHVLGPPPGWDENKHGPCVSLPVRWDEASGAWLSVWVPNEEELAALVRGGGVLLSVVGGTQPPVAVATLDPADSDFMAPFVEGTTENG